MSQNNAERWSASVELEQLDGSSLLVSVGFDYIGRSTASHYGIFMVVEDDLDLVYSNLDEDVPYVRTADRYRSILTQIGVSDEGIDELLKRAEQSVLLFEKARSEERSVKD